jgi:hypothetical protein
MTGHRAVVGLARALGDVDHVGDPVLALADLAAGLAQRPPGPEVSGERLSDLLCVRPGLLVS